MKYPWRRTRTIRCHIGGETYTEEIHELLAAAQGFHAVEVDTPKGKVVIDVPRWVEELDED